MRLERIRWERAAPPDTVALQRALEADGFSVTVWRDGPGADYPPHRHEYDESLWVLDGEITFGAGGREYRLGPGDRLMLPAGTVHTARAGSAGARYLIGERP